MDRIEEQTVNINPTIEMPEAQVLLNLFRQRIRKRLGCNVIFTGDLGSGKTYAGLRILELWYKFCHDEDFPLNHICKTLEDAIILIRDFKRDAEGILVEELSVLAGSRNALTRQNKLWNQFLDIVRLKKVIIVGNCPKLSFIDKHIIALAQVWLQAEGINFREKKSRHKLLAFQSSEFKTYYHHFFYNGKPVDGIILNIPSKRITDYYDAFKLKAHEEYCDEILMKLTHDKEKYIKNILKRKSKKELTPREQKAYDLYLKGVRSKDAYKIMGYKDTNCFGNIIRRIKNKLKLNELIVKN